MAKVEKIRMREPLVLNGGTAVTLGTVVGTKGEMVEFDLRRPICIDPSNRIAISRRMEDRWRLIGYGVVK
jgi:translation initiation factor 2 subunit 3